MSQYDNPAKRSMGYERIIRVKLTKNLSLMSSAGCSRPGIGCSTRASRQPLKTVPFGEGGSETPPPLAPSRLLFLIALVSAASKSRGSDVGGSNAENDPSRRVRITVRRWLCDMPGPICAGGEAKGTGDMTSAAREDGLPGGNLLTPLGAPAEPPCPPAPSGSSTFIAAFLSCAESSAASVSTSVPVGIAELRCAAEEIRFASARSVSLRRSARAATSTAEPVFTKAAANPGEFGVPSAARSCDTSARSSSASAAAAAAALRSALVMRATSPGVPCGVADVAANFAGDRGIAAVRTASASARAASSALVSAAASSRVRVRSAVYVAAAASAADSASSSAAIACCAITRASASSSAALGSSCRARRSSSSELSAMMASTLAATAAVASAATVSADRTRASAICARSSMLAALASESCLAAEAASSRAAISDSAAAAPAAAVVASSV
mmetsp:Transcript_34375/g.55145  ORF Transcript_34375/g.55145 Transcript_34375/m.55145 type:complete len:445 (+) Transcript_34375:1073-2407(+)